MDAGTRVEIPVYTDAWMRGDRYGVVVREVKDTGETLVKLDKSGRHRRFRTVDLEMVE